MLTSRLRQATLALRPARVAAASPAALPQVLCRPTVAPGSSRRTFHVPGPMLAAQPRAKTKAKGKKRGKAAAAAEADPEAKPAHGSHKVELRAYQKECIEAVTSAIAQGKKRLGVSLATGGGKTVVFTQLISRVAPLSSRATKTLILAHRRELVHQAAIHCSAAYPDSLVEIEMGNQRASGMADITVASMQSIISQDRLLKFNPHDYKLVLVDEAHHIVSAGYQAVLEHFGLRDTPAPDAQTPTLVGVSATFSRFDGLRLGAAIDEIVYHRDYVTMIGEKWLSDVVFTSVSSHVDLASVRAARNGDFATAELSSAVNTVEANELVVRTWLSLAAERRSTLVFCVDVAHVFALADEFVARGVAARVVTGTTPAAERAATLDAFRTGAFPVLVNCGVFTEGTDIPNIDCVLLTRPTRSRNLLVQMIGRGMRLFPGKKDCHVIDMVASLDTGITTVATLLGLDPSEMLHKASMADVEARRAELLQRQAEAGQTTLAGQTPLPAVPPPIEVDDQDVSVSFVKYDSVFDFIADGSTERTIRNLSKNAWLAVNQDTYVLCGPDGKYLRIEPIDDNDDGGGAAAAAAAAADTPAFKVSVTRPLPVHVVLARQQQNAGRPAEQSNAPALGSPQQLLTAHSLEAAVNGADSWAGKHMPHAFITRSMPWRRMPPTLGQLVFLNKMRNAPLTNPLNYEHQLAMLKERRQLKRQRGAHSAGAGEDRPTRLPPMGEPLTVLNLDKGMASDMITKIKHGAKGRFRQVSTEARRREKLILKKQREKDREVVRVGPLAV
ncbi:uncharacterized protein BROUX77_008016 [Berkeleyomyces rouxiae]|uniref:uncharacterized protein n=1 Tax=Berkeleyomyces rouxiae TaxID=2035830 RepID=UPI003B7F25A0